MSPDMTPSPEQEHAETIFSVRSAFVWWCHSGKSRSHAEETTDVLALPTTSSQHRGRIWGGSQPESRATFCFTLPAPWSLVESALARASGANLAGAIPLQFIVQRPKTEAQKLVS